MTPRSPSSRPAGTPARRALVLGAIVALGALALGGHPYVPVYDGVVPVPPYRWLDPPPGGQGSPEGATARIDVSGSSSPLIAVATPEDVPQAQIFAIPGGLVLPKATSRIDVSIEAVQPPSAPVPDGQVITGNVYAVDVTTQSGGAVTALPSAEVSVVLRAPDANQLSASVARFDGSSWQSLGTVSAGVGATFEGVVTQFGEFALLAAPPAPTAAVPAGSSTTGPAQTPATSGATASAGSESTGSPAAGSGALATESVPSPGASAAAAPAEEDRTLLTVGLGALAALIVVLLAVFAFGPRRRPPPPARSRRR